MLCGYRKHAHSRHDLLLDEYKCMNEHKPKFSEVVLNHGIMHFNHDNSIITKQRYKLDIEFLEDLRLKLNNLEPNTVNLAKS